MKTKILHIFPLTVLIFLLTTTCIQAVTKTWVPTTGGAWTTGANWSPSGVPGTGDDVVISADQSAAITAVGTTNGQTVSVNGLTINGNCNFQSDAGSGNSTTLNVTSFFSVNSGKTLTIGLSNYGRLNFTLAATATGTVNGIVYMNSYSSTGYDRTFTNSGNLTISGTGLVSGQNSSDFILSSGATLQIANAAGIMATGATGAVQIPGTRTYSAGANYVYNGTTNQSTGDGYPTALTGSLTIDNPGNTVTIVAAARTITTGTLNLTDGIFATNNGGNRLSLGSTATINRSEGSMTGTPQGTGIYDVNYTGNSKTAGSELDGSGLYDVTVNLTGGQTLTSSAAAFTVDNDLTVSQGELVLSATNADYSFKNVLVSTNGTLTHSVPWDNAPNRMVGISGNLDVTGIFNPTIRSHVSMNGAGSKTIRTGDNPASTLSILTFSTGTFTANGTLKTNQEVWAMFGTPGSFSTNGSNVTFSTMNNNNGTINVNGGSLTINGGCEIGYGPSAGVMNISSGSFSVGGDFLINATASVVCTNSPSISVAGNWTKNGSFTAATGTVTLNGGAQTIGGSAATNFYNLSLSGSGTKIFGAARAISNNLSIGSGVVADLGTFTSSAGYLSLGGLGVSSGSWGSTSSSATNKNDIYFSPTSGIINVSASSCASVTATITGQSNITCYGAKDGTITITATGGTGPWSYSVNNGTNYTADANNPHTFTGLSPNVAYQIRVKDSNGCESPAIP